MGEVPGWIQTTQRSYFGLVRLLPNCELHEVLELKEVLVLQNTNFGLHYGQLDGEFEFCLYLRNELFEQDLVFAFEVDGWQPHKLFAIRVELLHVLTILQLHINNRTASLQGLNRTYFRLILFKRVVQLLIFSLWLYVGLGQPFVVNRVIFSELLLRFILLLL